MPAELRKDPVTGRWVIISAERAKRPIGFQETIVERSGGFCPFCEGNEQHTPPELLAYRNGSERDQPGWSLRVVSNKYPALQIEGELNREGEGMFDKMSGIGAHEVIVETPQHDQTLAKMPLKNIENLFWAFRDRVLDLKKDKRFRYILLFKNEGHAAGASLEHSHSQIIALPIIPKLAGEEIAGAKAYFQYKERCVYCDIIMQERNEQSRIIEENPDFVALSPFAPRFPFETWVLPKQHGAFFEDAQKREYEHLAKMLKSLLLKMDKVLESPPYNMIIHSSPFYENTQDFYHWHMELMPKMSKIAGFEWGTGFYINPTPPEEAAQFLRDTVVHPEK
ncbi:MAG: galactose-1-phosphate uridylyltransferase [Acidobacteria bacterium]|nr:MAG: galactose-1-phosphate uridylyltransferase [Acidobacteriota bacterium]